MAIYPLPWVNMAFIALDAHAQDCVAKVTWLTNVCADPNNESGCVAILVIFQTKLLSLKCDRFVRSVQLSLK